MKIKYLTQRYISNLNNCCIILSNKHKIQFVACFLQSHEYQNNSTELPVFTDL